MKLVLALSAVTVLLLASKRQDLEAADGDLTGGFDVNGLTDALETGVNVLTEGGVVVGADMASKNVKAFLSVIRQAEGTARAFDPYAVCFGYRHTIQSYRDHPAVTGEWLGEVLPDSMCRGAGYGPGCKSTAAGAYQIIKPTWLRLKNRLNLFDFSPSSQDLAAIELVRARGALNDVMNGRFESAVSKCRNEWASLPGNYAGQGQRSMASLRAWFNQSGGVFA